MQKVCSSVLLLTKDKRVVEAFNDTALSIGDVRVRVSEEWNESYRVSEEVIIADSEYLESIGDFYIDRVVLRLKLSESFLAYKDRVKKFIFMCSDERQRLYALMIEGKAEPKLSEKTFRTEHYAFDFERKEFFFDGKGIWLTKGEQDYLKSWLLLGEKDNRNRFFLFNMRKRFGKGFLADIDRFGEERK